ncbi:TniQ family protein [Arsenicicoccus bolidensis]|uniref:TniQ family protein n=1 Tax=Arsenicicoccus bolidensis TaxID=229480 RepID=UPI0028B0598A|nr:TniQ family protein [Arsenicicoccus bolidensis]
MTGRWPLHPPPGEGEALTSWLSRLAEVYGFSAEELIRHNLGPPGGFGLPEDHTSALDLTPPAGVLPTLAARTGVPLDQLRHMTVAGQAPWLLDTLDPEPVPGAAFDTYVHQNSVLLTAKERPRRQVPGWRAWLPTSTKHGALRRACPTCQSTAAAGTFGFTLISQLPLTLSCPHHGCHLDPAFGGLGAFVAWEKQDTGARAAPAAVVAMDARTHQALRTGTVTLPRRSVHVGVWCRLLRTLIDELCAPVSALRTRSHRSVRHIWHVAGHPVRAGMVAPWRPYEALPWPKQQMLLEAAAAALDLIETGEITAHGTLASLLTPEPHRPVPDGTPPDRHYWQQAEDALSTAVALAQHDPAPARQLLATLTALTRSEVTFQRIRDDLIVLGIPDDHLPRTLAEQRARQTPAGPTTTVTSCELGTLRRT